MAEGRIGLFILTIISVVAIVGLVTIYLNSGTSIFAVGPDENVAGQAAYFSRLSVTKLQLASKQFPLSIAHPEYMPSPASEYECTKIGGATLTTGPGVLTFRLPGDRYPTTKRDACKLDGDTVIQYGCNRGDSRGYSTVELQCSLAWMNSRCTDGICSRPS